jgi:hypothetical protein
MAVSGTIDELEGLLKVTYVDGVNEQMATDNMFLVKLEGYGMKVPVEGSTPKFNTQWERSGGIGFRNTASAIPDLPDARTGRHKQITVDIKELYGREEFNIVQVETAKGGGTFVKTIVDKTDQLVRDFRDAYGLSLYTNKYGAITKASAVTVSQYVLAVDDLVRLQEGNVVDLIDTTDGAVMVRKMVVSSYDTATKRITFDLTNATKGTGSVACTTLVGSVLGIGANLAVAAGDMLVFEKSYNLSYSGLDAQILEAGTIHDIDRDTYTYYKSSLKALGTNLITNNYLRLLKNDIKVKSKNEKGYKLDCGLGNYDEISGFESTLDDLVRYPITTADKAPNLTGGYTNLRHDDIDIIGCRYATAATLFLLSTKSYMLYQIADTKFMDMGKGMFNRKWQQGQFEYALYNFQELVCYNPRANGALTGVKGLSAV